MNKVTLDDVLFSLDSSSLSGDIIIKLNGVEVIFNDLNNVRHAHIILRRAVNSFYGSPFKPELINVILIYGDIELTITTSVEVNKLRLCLLRRAILLDRAADNK